MQLTPFVNSGPGILPLDTPFEVPDWWQPTGCRWNFEPRKHKKDKDGQRTVKYNKKFALRGEVSSYKFGTVAKYPLSIACEAGLVCSRESLLLVIECDEPDKWDAALLGDAVPTVRSSRGHHFYFAVPIELADLLPTDGPIPGGDVQTSGFVPAPGTMHPSGVRYELVADRINVADIGLLTRIADVREAHRVAQLTEYKARGGSGNWSGNGGVNGQDDYLAKVVLWNALRAGKSRAETWTEWKREADALPLHDKEDPFDESDFDRQYETARRKLDRQTADASWEMPEGLSEEAERWARWLSERGSGGGADEPPTVPPQEWRFEPEGYQPPLNYKITPSGVYQLIKEGKEVRQEQLSHRPLIVSGVRLGEDDDRWYDLQWGHEDGTRGEITVPACDIAERSRLLKIFPEIVVVSKGATGASEYLAHCVTANGRWLGDRQVRFATALGWYEGTSEFVSSDGSPFSVMDTANLGSWLRGFRKQGTLADWKSGMAAAPERVRIAVCASLAGVLLRILEIPGFVLDMSGATTKGKTKALRACASAWGDPDSVLLSWSATKAALELYAKHVRGVPLLIDDSKLARDGEQISGLIYQVTSGMSTGRLERSTDRLRGAEHIETVVITNGEQPLLSASGRRDGGAAARVIEMWGAPFASAVEADSLNAVITENYGHAGEFFARAAMEAGAGELRSRYHVMREHARALGETDVARRRADALAGLMLAAKIASDILLLPPVRTESWSEMMDGDAGREGSDDLAAAALEALWNELTFNEAIFWNKDNPSITSSFDRPRDGWKGRYDKGEDWLAVKPDWLDEFLIRRGFDAEGIRRQWADREWVSKDSKGKRTVIVRIGSGTARCVKVTHRPDSLLSGSSQEAKGYSDE